MAAQAGQQAVNVGRPSGHAGRQSLDVTGGAVVLPVLMVLPEQVADVLAPQNGVAGSGVAGLVGAVAPCAAVRGVAGRATATVI